MHGHGASITADIQTIQAHETGQPERVADSPLVSVVIPSREVINRPLNFRNENGCLINWNPVNWEAAFVQSTGPLSPEHMQEQQTWPRPFQPITEAIIGAVWAS